MSEINYTEIAEKIIINILQDNGCINRLEKNFYPEWVYKIAGPVEKFFSKFPQLIDDNFFELLCTDPESISITIKALSGYKELENILDDFFENGITEAGSE